VGKFIIVVANETLPKLRQFALTTSETQTAIKLFCPPKNDPIVKLTGGQPQLDQRCRTEFMSPINAISAEAIVDSRYAEIEHEQRAQQALANYQAMVNALVPRQPPPAVGDPAPPAPILPPPSPPAAPFEYGDEGENIAEATTHLRMPGENEMVVARQADVSDRELQVHHQTMIAIAALAAGPRATETVRENTRQEGEV
jgi:hypothetical protein